MSETLKSSSETKPDAKPGAPRNGTPAGNAPAPGGAPPPAQPPPPAAVTSHAPPGGSTTGGTSGAETPAADFAAALQEFLHAMLERQCRLVGAAAGIVYLAASGARQASIGATYVLPAGDTSGRLPVPASARVSLDQAMVARLSRHAAEAVKGPLGQPRAENITLQAPDAKGLYHADATHRVLACPLVAAEQVHGASVVVVPLSSARQVAGDPSDSLERLSLAAAAYEAFLWRNHSFNEAQTKTRLRETLELLDAAQQSEDAETMGAIFCHELQRRFGCTRVSIGLIRGARLRVVGVSGADDIAKHAAVIESLESLMEECAEQDVEIVFPMPPEDENDPARRRVTRAHAQHSTKFGPAAILSLPLRVSGDLVGVVTMEREPTDPFPAGAVPLLRLVAEFIGPALWTRRMADRKVLAVTRDRIAELAMATLGPRHTGAKALAALVVLTLALMAFVPIPGRINADAETHALVSRTIPPPFEGFLESILVKPGDRVKAGDVLATMDMKDTLLQLEQANFRLQKLVTQQSNARNAGAAGQGDAAIYTAAIEEVRGEIRLYEDRLGRGNIISPISGEVSRGDIEPLAGAKVEPTSPLFEIIEPGKHVIVLKVKERDIGGVSLDQPGRLAVTALPDTKLPVRVTRIRPLGEAIQKGNVFIVEASLDPAELPESPDWLKPGMTGTARLEHGYTTVLWELCKPLVDAARMRLWW